MGADEELESARREESAKLTRESERLIDLTTQLSLRLQQKANECEELREQLDSAQGTDSVAAAELKRRLAWLEKENTELRSQLEQARAQAASVEQLRHESALLRQRYPPPAPPPPRGDDLALPCRCTAR